MLDRVVETLSGEDDRELERFTRSLAFQNTVDRPKFQDWKRCRDTSFKNETRIDTAIRRCFQASVKSDSFSSSNSPSAFKPAPQRHSVDSRVSFLKLEHLDLVSTGSD